MLTKTVMGMQGNMVQFQGETRASIKDLERQLGQVSGLLSRLESIWISGELPIQKESNLKQHFACFKDEDTVLEIEEMTPSCVNGDVVVENTLNDEVLVETSEALMSMVIGEVSYRENSPTLVPHVTYSTKLDRTPSFPLFLPHSIHAPLLE